MSKTVIAEGFDGNQMTVMDIRMSCKDWDLVGAALAGIAGSPYQGVANRIQLGLMKVGYFQAVDE